jgi:hypothetical protein
VDWVLRVCCVFVSAILLAGLVEPSTAFATIEPYEVIGGHGVQVFAFANDSDIVWTTNSTRYGQRFNAYVRPRFGGATVKINAPGTQGFTGGFDPGTDTVIYQQVQNGRSRLYWYDLDTSTRSLVVGVNSKRWEWGPRVSASYILFARDHGRKGITYTSLYLFDRRTSTTRRLGTWRRARYRVQPGSVGQRYATWTLCRRRTCFAYLYTIASRDRQRIPARRRRPQFAQAVTEANGAVYFLASGASCGAGVAIMRLRAGNLSARPTKILDLPAGIDVGYTMSMAPDRNGSDQDLLFDRVRCRSSTSDVYEVDAVNAVR